MANPEIDPSSGQDKRKTDILENSISVFLRYGFRKTSMDDIARAAGISRQGLYLYFSAKEDLFKASVSYLLETSLSSAKAKLSDKNYDIQDRLVNGFEEWMGRFIGVMGEGSGDLAEAGRTLVGNMIEDYEVLFQNSVGETIDSSYLKSYYKSNQISVKQLLENLYAVSKGLKYIAKSKEDFRERFANSVNIICKPARRQKA
ncbi:TetR/AcrR family transcriptional regulator [Leptospira idonii]|uniref:TetR/AcrR family transcriptional regulator n=1 Tax=Leptospira idonii TaxID=1193500 RepID=A0A4R9LWS9_9LEPT|nr:TetR/AcrR family transcriptional regulator [Leptospira idonii]TGN18753.1 TetR/AcrR family transcriptional regulator [Leptospira idonii]